MNITKYVDGDEVNILELFQIAFGKEMSIDYWEWRFLNNPVSKEPMIYLMWDDDKRLVGHYAVSPNEMVVGQKNYLSALSMTTMTHPDYAGRGIFSKLAMELYRRENEEKNLSLVWGFPNNNSHRGFVKNLAWQNATIIPSFSLDISSFRYKSALITANFKEVNSFTSENILCHNQLQEAFYVKQKKDCQFFKWRYLENPENDYVVMQCEENHAFVVVKLFHSEIDILEWSVPDNFQLFLDAINSILILFKDHSITKINLWIPLDDKRHLDLEKLGFVYTEPITYLGYTLLDQRTELNKEQWYFQMGDSDVY